MCLQIGHRKSNSESIVQRTKGASSMNLLGFTVTVQHTRQRDPHISKENDQQLEFSILSGLVDQVPLFKLGTYTRACFQQTILGKEVLIL